MATSFGQADTGLIKATAGAEAGQHIDENLMIGSVIGGVAAKISAGYADRQKSAKKASDKLNADFASAYKVPDGQLDPQMASDLHNLTMEHKKIYVNNQGKDVESRRNLAASKRNYDARIAEYDQVMGTLQVSRGSEIANDGWNAERRYEADLFKNGQYERGTRINESTGEQEGYYATKKLGPASGEPKRDEAMFERLAELENIRNQGVQQTPPVELTMSEQEEYEKLTEKSRAYNTSSENYKNEVKNWDNLPDFVEGVNGQMIHNPKTYKTHGFSDIPSYGSTDELNSAVLETYEDDLTDLSSDSDFNQDKSSSQYTRNFKKSLKEKSKTHDDRMNLVFGDFSDDKVTFEDAEGNVQQNSFANMFIYEQGKPGEDGELNPMYLDLDGKPITLVTDSGEPVEYGSEPWKAIVPESKKQEYMEKFLRSEDENGNTKTEENKDWLMDKYTNFMGDVKKDHFEQKQRAHFEGQNRYFDDGTTDRGVDNVYDNEQYQFAAKEKAYNGALLENGFPEGLLNGTDANNAYLIKELQPGGKILEALKAEYENAKDPDSDGVEIKSSGTRRSITVTIDGKKRSFDFDGEDSKEQYKEMKKFLTKAKLSTSLVRDPRAVPNTVDDWGKKPDANATDKEKKAWESSIRYRQMGYHNNGENEL